MRSYDLARIMVEQVATGWHAFPAFVRHAHRIGAGVAGVEFVLAHTALSCPAFAASAPERWLLMSREGECAPIASLRRRIPDLADVESPDAFIALMKKKGHAVTSTATQLSDGTVYEVQVPDQRLAVIFVPARICARGSRR